MPNPANLDDFTSEHIAGIAADIAGAGAPALAEGQGQPSTSGSGPGGATGTPEELPLPKAWKKDMEPHWGTLPAEVRRYVHEREGQVSRGFQQYQAGHKAWSDLIAPYQELFQQYPDLQPGQIFNNLMQTHLALTFGAPEQKQALIEHLKSAYGLTTAEAKQVAKEAAAAAPVADPRVDQLTQTVYGLQEALHREQVQKNLQAVEKFFNDPAYPHAKALEADILRLVQAGERDLVAAYEQAKWLNPEVRQKLTVEMGKAPPPGPRNVRSADGNPPAAPRQGTIDDTIDAIVQKHFG